MVNDYIGKICPFCKTEFKDGDEIVVCSECDMPHHKDCWIENQGCTTFGCRGTIKAADNSVTSVTQTQMDFDDASNSNAEGIIYCSRCGAQNFSSASFCSKCGNKLIAPVEPFSSTPTYGVVDPKPNTSPYAYAVRQDVNLQQSNYYYSNSPNSYQSRESMEIDADVQQLIGIKAEYYLPKFQELKSQSKKTSWNWPAFLVSPYWFIYRKMYGYGAAVMGAAFLTAIIGSVFLSLIMFVAYIMIGIYGNYIYLQFLENKSQQAKNMMEPYKTQFIIQHGGVNPTATTVSVVGYMLLTILLSI